MPDLRALLLDLDGTLLVNDVAEFMAAYRASIMPRMSSLCPLVRLAEAFEAGSLAMIRNDGTDGTNADAFYREFLPRAGCTMEDVAPLMEAYYAGEFNALRQYTAVDPAARRLVSLARERGYQVAIATQPVFPREAILARLRWADVPDEEFRYDYISSFDVQRACKPHREFFQAILRHLGRRPEECLMVGDSATSDLPAGRLGIKTFWVQGAEGGVPAVEPDARGSLADLVTLVESGGIHELF